ncbi:unnamed protein product [Caenorhabditis angaria]|uniref:Uncharacterized protein n=1 Tax=Caenorhabditis angaria TaxID=860376 RepID=A0A9P1IAN3_9PELO|nr:unnamed protein product [Caenorhabditis angaria]
MLLRLLLIILVSKFVELRPTAPRIPDLFPEVTQDLIVATGQELEEIKKSISKIPEINQTLEELDSNFEDISSDFALSSNDIEDNWKSAGSSKFRDDHDDELTKIHKSTKDNNLPPFAFSEDSQDVVNVDSDVAAISSSQPAFIKQSWNLHKTSTTTEQPITSTVPTTTTTSTERPSTVYPTLMSTSFTSSYNSATSAHEAWRQHLANQGMVPAFRTTSTSTQIPESVFNSKLNLKRPARVTIFGAPMKGYSKKRAYSTIVKARGTNPNSVQNQTLHEQILATSQILNLLGDKIETIDQANYLGTSPKIGVLSNIYNRGRRVRRLKQKQWGSSLKGRLGRYRQIMDGKGKYMTKAIVEAPGMDKTRQHSHGIRRRKEKNFAEALLESEEQSFKQLKSTLRQIRDVVKLKSVQTTTEPSNDSSSFGGSFDFVRK